MLLHVLRLGQGPVLLHIMHDNGGILLASFRVEEGFEILLRHTILRNRVPVRDDLQGQIAGSPQVMEIHAFEIPYLGILNSKRLAVIDILVLVFHNPEMVGALP